MATLADQLRKAGLVSEASERSYREHLVQSEINAPDKGGTSKRVAVDSIDLDTAKSMREFKQMAKEILTNDPSQIDSIIQKAHEKFNGQKGDKKLFWFFYQIRDELKKLPKEKHSELLRKAFRKSGSTFNISE